jgi:hypothetical protein
MAQPFKSLRFNKYYIWVPHACLEIKYNWPNVSAPFLRRREIKTGSGGWGGVRFKWLPTDQLVYRSEFMVLFSLFRQSVNVNYVTRWRFHTTIIFFDIYLFIHVIYSLIHSFTQYFTHSFIHSCNYIYLFHYLFTKSISYINHPLACSFMVFTDAFNAVGQCNYHHILNDCEFQFENICMKNRSWPIVIYYLVLFWRGWGKTRNISSRIAEFWAETCCREYLNTL